MVIFGWMRRGIILGAKLDECPRCGSFGPQIIIRLVWWFCLFFVPVLPFWLSHKLVCPECTYEDELTFEQTRDALKSKRLRTGRSRPGFMAALNDHPDMVDPEDWRAFGLEPNASPEMIKARWRELAKKNHPDLGGSTPAFARLQAVYQRLLRAGGRQTAWDSARAEDALQEVIPNPNPGGWNTYLKAWPFIAATALVVLVLANSDFKSAASGVPTRSPEALVAAPASATPSATPRPTPTPTTTPEPTATPIPTPTPVPTPTPKPTPPPLQVTEMRYQTKACTAEFDDGEKLLQVAVKVTIRNNTKTKSDVIWMEAEAASSSPSLSIIESSDDGYAPLFYFGGTYGGVGYEAGTRIAAGKTKALYFYLLFDTKKSAIFDVRLRTGTTDSISSFDDPNAILGPAFKSWSGLKSRSTTSCPAFYRPF